MKTLLLSAAAIAAAATLAPAIAQTAPAAPARHAMMQRHMNPVTRNQVAGMIQKHFARLDSNHDGYVTKPEMDAAETAIRQKMEQRESALFDRIDTNKDGSISRAEFDAAHQAMAGHMGEKGGMGMHPMATMHGMHGGMMERMFATADANKDGRVSLQEATSAALAHFDAVDTNHDGTLSPEEMRAAHQAMTARPGR